MTEEKPFGWTTDAANGEKTIVSAGQPPTMVRNSAGTVRLKRNDAAILNVTQLDFNGYRTGTPRAHGESVTLATNVVYYLIEQ